MLYVDWVRYDLLPTPAFVSNAFLHKRYASEFLHKCIIAAALIVVCPEIPLSLNFSICFLSPRCPPWVARGAAGKCCLRKDFNLQPMVWFLEKGANGVCCLLNLLSNVDPKVDLVVGQWHLLSD